MNPIAGALSSGYSIQHILRYLSQHNPQLAAQISAAINAGYSAEHIGKYLSKHFGKVEKIDESQPRNRASNLYKTAQTDIHPSLIGGAKVLGTAAALAGGIGGAYALSRALPRMLQSGAPQIGQTIMSPSLGPGPTSPGVQVLGPTPSTPPPGVNPLQASQLQRTAGTTLTPQAQQPPVSAINTADLASNIAKPPASQQVIKPQRDIKKSVDILKNLGQEASVKNMLDGGMPAKDIAGVLKAIMPKDKWKALEAQEGGIEGAIEDYAASRHVGQAEGLGGLQSVDFAIPLEDMANEPMNLIGKNKALAPEIAPVEEAPEPEVAVEPPKPIAKKDIVASPQGIGEVKELRNGKALVEVDGKLHKVDEEDLEPTIYTEEQIAKAYNDLMNMIPEPEKSRFISWAGYDEDRKVLGYIPRGGKYEELIDITPEEAELIRTGKGVARTTGESREGFHIMGGDTRGLISQIQHDRRRKREGLEAQQLKLFDLAKPEKQDRGMKPIFDEMAYARSLSRARDKKAAEEARAKKKKEKEEEIARLKRERYEAKKRKKQA